MDNFYLPPATYEKQKALFPLSQVLEIHAKSTWPLPAAQTYNRALRIYDDN